ncbi:hypothetical protein [Blastococcus sp. URHD0036]|uniref:hypothetical protein n=1 Tax=Blastococcus sp. URHD0036 TaxID=1380356 RepID=UPI00049716FC|nr:hypothetical protein [Blastococcus sp. URHD0036]
MPVDARGRAAASITQPLDAEVLADGAWWPGAVLGWRHDESGGCEAQVRVVRSGGPQVRWVDLRSVRLPEPTSLPPAAPAGRAEVPAETVMMSRSELRGLLASGPSGSASPGTGRRRRHAADLTAELPVIRCAEADPGRHRAPATAPTAVVGRHRAADETRRPASVPGARSGGREADLSTRPIRMDDVAGWPWSDVSA